MLQRRARRPLHRLCLVVLAALLVPATRAAAADSSAEAPPQPGAATPAAAASPPAAYPGAAYPPAAYPPASQPYGASAPGNPYPAYPPGSYAPQPYGAAGTTAPYGSPGTYAPYPVYAQPGMPMPGARPRPLRLRYREGDPIPPGYHLVQRTRLGFLIPGLLMIGVPYVIGSAIAVGVDFRYGTGWLTVPVLGPWLTLLFMPSNNCSNATDDFCDAKEFLRGYARVYLVLDGVLQGAGAVLTVIGMKGAPVLVADSYALSVTPGRVGTGYGVVLTGWSF